MNPDLLTTWVIYRYPRDYPNHYVVRAWHTFPGETLPYPATDCTLAHTLADARAAIPPGLHRLAAMAGDDACIEETWV